MRIMYLSSDVCSSYLIDRRIETSPPHLYPAAHVQLRPLCAAQRPESVRRGDLDRRRPRNPHGLWARVDAFSDADDGRAPAGRAAVDPLADRPRRGVEIGRASCRERVCQYVYIPGGAV